MSEKIDKQGLLRVIGAIIGIPVGIAVVFGFGFFASGTEGSGVMTLLRAGLAAWLGGSIGCYLGNEIGGHLYREGVNSGSRSDASQAIAPDNEAVLVNGSDSDSPQAVNAEDPEYDPIKVVLAMGAWNIVRTQKEAAWASLDEGMSREAAEQLVGDPKAIAGDDNCIVYQYAPEWGAGSLTFVEGRLACWTEAEYSEFPPESWLNAMRMTAIQG